MRFKFRSVRRKSKPVVDEKSAVFYEKHFREWLATPMGKQLVALEQDATRNILGATAGYRTAEFPVADVGRFRDLTPQLHRFAIADCPQQGISALSELHELPLPSSVVDVAILHHLLDFCDFPHETLKEVSRIVVPSGYLVIIGFNPFSWLGLLRWPLRCFSANVVWKSRGLSAFRVTDWLRLLGFQCEKIIYGAYNPPLNFHRYISRTGWIERLGRRIRLPVGNFYIIVARKQRLRPIANRQRWLVNAIKPKLASDASAKPVKNGSGTCRKKKC